MPDPSDLLRAALLLGAVRAPTVTHERRTDGPGHVYVARVWLPDGEHTARDPFPGLALHKLMAARGIYWH
jgi:hypothetical protein